MRAGNLAAVMKTMGHRDVKTAMHYQHSELEVVRAALDYGAPSSTSETTSAARRTYGTFHVPPENHHVSKTLKTSADTRLRDAAGE
jgi:hypothetical protein